MYWNKVCEDIFKSNMLNVNFKTMNSEIDNIAKPMNNTEHVFTITKSVNDNVSTITQRVNDNVSTITQRVNDNVSTITQRVNDLGFFH
jgi:mannose/fructose/N-acetylgalactosamine-specific phosphotransferase system component IIB